MPSKKKADEAGSRTLTLPPEWGTNSLVLHFEGEEPDTPDPFAAIMMLQLRLDVPPGMSATSVRSADLALLNSTQPLEFVEADEVALGGRKVGVLEWADGGLGARTLRHLVLYVEHGDRVYTLTATHVAERFERIRGPVLDFATSLLAENGPLGAPTKA